ncbi:hypothetical protein Tco_1499925 [Tanacetum coccineum]
MVIDDCLFDKNYDLTLVAKVKKFASMPNLRIIFNDEGFENVTIRYLGGFLVSLKFTDTNACDNFKRHEGVDTWFSIIQPWKNDFRVDERELWVDVEGILSVAWTNKTFTKIEKGKVSVIRAREIIVWTPDFMKEEIETSSDNGDEESEKLIPYTDICSGVKGKESSESDGKRNMDNNNGDTFSKPIQASRHVEKEQQSECNMNSVKGGGVSDKDSSLPKGKCLRIASSLLEKMNEFVEIGQAMGFSMDGYMPLGGFSFTCAVKDATKMSKLDRFLVSDGLLCQVPAMSGLILARHLSDHRPIILRDCDVDYGPIPFKTFHSWFNIEGFEQLVKDSWHNDVVVDLNDMSYLKKKFQMLKKKIKIWAQQNRVKANVKRKEIQENLQNIDKQIDQKGDLVQKAKVKWAIEGDENSKYFHGIINKKRHQMDIRGVSVNGEWVMDHPKVKQEFFQHFANRFSSCPNPRIRFLNDEVFPVSLNQHQHHMLEEEDTDVEIKKAVWDCGRDKSPGPNGFTFEFIRKFWEVIGGDVCRVVKCFFRSGSFPKGCNPSFIALIPKVNDAKFVKDFRLINDAVMAVGTTPMTLSYIVFWLVILGRGWDIKLSLSLVYLALEVSSELGVQLEKVLFFRKLRQAEIRLSAKFILLVNERNLLHILFRSFAMLRKHFFKESKFKAHPEAMWVLVIKAIHGPCGNLDQDNPLGENIQADKMPTQLQTHRIFQLQVVDKGHMGTGDRTTVGTMELAIRVPLYVRPFQVYVSLRMQPFVAHFKRKEMKADLPKKVVEKTSSYVPIHKKVLMRLKFITLEDCGFDCTSIIRKHSREFEIDSQEGEAVDKGEESESKCDIDEDQ